MTEQAISFGNIPKTSRLYKDFLYDFARVAPRFYEAEGRDLVSLVARAPRVFVCTTDSAPAEPLAKNLLARRFALTDHPVRDSRGVGDMTDIPTHCGWLSLAVLIDLATAWWSAGQQAPRWPRRCPCAPCSTPSCVGGRTLTD